MDRIRLGMALAGVALVLACTSSVAYTGERCSAASYREARSAMTSRLLATGYSRKQVSFLMRNVDRMTSALRADKLNENGGACGIDSARAHVLGCLGQQLFPLKSGASASLDEEKQTTREFWGRRRLAVRELLFIGQFNGCLGAAKERLFRG